MPDNLLWTPEESAIKGARLTEFAAGIGFKPPHYPSLHRWSVQNRAEFWDRVWRYTDIIGYRGSTVALHEDRFPGTQWFPESRLNFAENLLRFTDDRTALIAINEEGQRSELTFRELGQRAAQFADFLVDADIQQNDRVAAWLPNIPEAVIGMLGTASIGAIWSSVSPDFGVAGALDRIGQIQPRILLACTGYQYNGKQYDVRAKVEQVRDAVKGIERIVWLDHDSEASFDAIWERKKTRLEYRRLPFNHPVYIMYSSGTTGKPKCIVHGAGGTLIQHLKEHQLHVDLRREDRIFFFTTTGWMMWNWLISALATGSTVVLYDGSPFAPQPSRLLDLIDTEQLTVFGVGAKYLASIQKTGLEPTNSHQLTSLRTILSTGSPLSHESFQYVYKSFKPQVQLASISGGTDLISCFVLGNPWSPVFEGEIQGAGLGMDVDVVNDHGGSLAGTKGELICRSSFPSAPIGFWNDEGDRRYRSTYFERFPNAWAHGDFAERMPDTGGFLIHGRSDAVLNPGGVTIGTAEIYRQVETISEVVDSVCVEQQWQDDTRVVLFIVLQEGIELDDMLISKIKQRIRENATPRHVPKKIIAIPDIPRTRSGKIAELAVREVIHGRQITNTTALENPESLDSYRELLELH